MFLYTATADSSQTLNESFGYVVQSLDLTSSLDLAGSFDLRHPQYLQG